MKRIRLNILFDVRVGTMDCVDKFAMEASMIESFVRQFAVEGWVKKEGFITKDAYYRFADILQLELDSMQNKSVIVEFGEVCF